MANPVSGQHRPDTAVAGMKMDKFILGLRPGVPPTLGCFLKKYRIDPFLDGDDDLGSGQVYQERRSFVEHGTGGHVRTVEPVFVETDKSQPAQILGGIRPKIIADKGSEADQLAVVHLLQSGHVPMWDGSKAIR